MTSQNCRRPLISALACGVVAGSLFAGIGAQAAIAAPGDDTTDTAAPKMTGEQALAIIQQDYDLGAGGGQLSNYVHEVLVLRNLGFRPSKANQTAIAEALEKRPNQAPLVEALKATVALSASTSGAWFGLFSSASAIAFWFAFDGLKPRLRSTSTSWT